MKGPKATAWTPTSLRSANGITMRSTRGPGRQIAAGERARSPASFPMARARFARQIFSILRHGAAGMAKISRSSSWIPTKARSKNPQSHVCVAGALPRLFHGNQLSPGVASVYCDALEPGLSLLGTKGRLFHDLAGFHPLEQARTGVNAESNAQPRAEGNWSYAYFSLIDPKSTDSSYMTITDSPYLYYVRMDGDHPPYQRILFRQKIKLDWLAPLRPKPAASAGAKSAH